MAISAISVTEERQQVVDFTNVYFVSEDAVLAGADSSVGAISSAEDMGGLKLGVESGTVYATWAQGQSGGNKPGAGRRFVPISTHERCYHRPKKRPDRPGRPGS